ncbi:M3 family oligoendopeptidase, partial [Clostridium polynesiense]|uniref:M3 family oligoendopeptidase n=1 Tax=Clostridium polynesiense TaxID=1325933 RepID=UPI0011C794E3
MNNSFLEKARTGLYDMGKSELLEDAFNELCSKEVGSVEELQIWLKEKDEIFKYIEEVTTKNYINFNSYNDNEEYKKRFVYDQEVLNPIIEKYKNRLDKKFYESKFRDELTSYYNLINRRVKNSIELFREENINLGIEESKNTTKYFDITGSMTVMWRGEEKTLPEMNKYLKDSDRGIREEAWKTVFSRRLKDALELDNIMDELIKIRNKIAKNAGCKDYVEYKFKELLRFD